jgi:hypothetical protein
MELIILDYLENTPLSTQLERLGCPRWNDGYTSVTGGKASTLPGHIIVDGESKKMFLMPKKKSKIEDFLNWNFDRKLKMSYGTECIEINEQTFDHLLECVPPVRMGNGSFLSGEAWHHRNVAPTFACCFTVNERYFLTFTTVHGFEHGEHLHNFQDYLESYDL